MLTEIDEGKGLVKTTWKNIRNRVIKVEPKFAALVDEISPNHSFPIFLAYYPYGDLIGDTKSPFFPKLEGGSYRLAANEAPKEVITHLGYGIGSIPLMMILEKNMEWFIDLPEENLSIPCREVSVPGAIFPLSRTLRKGRRIYSPNGVLSTSSGVRSTFVLPNIGCINNHMNLQRDYNIRSLPPKNFYEHWYLFKEIINSQSVNSDWRSCAIYFSEKWLTNILSDPAWQALKSYLHELAWERFEYEKHRFYYDIIYSVITKKLGIKPNPYLLDTAKHLFTIALGEAPGYTPANDTESLPLDILQKAFIESYGLKKHIPTIMLPTRFDFEQGSAPVYYSLQNPSVHMFSPKSRQLTSTLFEMRELANIMNIFINDLSRDDSMCSDTILSEVAKGIEINYFHNEKDSHGIIRPSLEIPKLDERFLFSNYQDKIPDAKFANDAKFLRGCISIQAKGNCHEN